MMKAVWRIVGDPNDTKDVLQEASLKIWRKWNLIVRHVNPQALIIRICINAAYDHLRKQKRSSSLINIYKNFSHLTKFSSGDHIKNHNHFMDGFLMKLIGGLSKNQRAALHMRYLQEHSYRDIAEELGCHESTARKHVERALKNLKRKLSGSFNPNNEGNHD